MTGTRSPEIQWLGTASALRSTGTSVGWRSLAYLLIESADGPGWQVAWRGGTFTTAAGEGFAILPHTEHRLAMVGRSCRSTWSSIDCAWSDGGEPFDGQHTAVLIGRAAMAVVARSLRRLAALDGQDWRSGVRRQVAQRELLLALDLPWREPRQLDPRIRALLLRIDEHPERHLSCRELADGAGLGLAHLHALFRRETGLSPAAWMTRRRMRAAQTLLTTTTLPVAEVAVRCGFADPFHFSRVFRRSTGLSPRAFRSGSTGG